ncbi:MAG: hypothetical protein ACYC8T_06585 [Myxococcaceae bacterium]
MIALVLAGVLLAQPPAPSKATAAVLLTKRVGASPERARGVVRELSRLLSDAGVRLLPADEVARRSSGVGIGDPTSCEGRKACALELGKQLGVEVVVVLLLGQVQGDVSVHAEALEIEGKRKLAEETRIIPSSALARLAEDFGPFARRVRGALPDAEPVVVKATEPVKPKLPEKPREPDPVEVAASGPGLSVWAPAAAGVALAAGGGVLLLMAKGNSDALTGGPGGTSQLGPEAALAARDSGRFQQTLGLVLVGAGVVALGAAGGMTLVGGPGEQVTAAPFVGPGGAGLAISGVWR